jgi:hypothetical protein
MMDTVLFTDHGILVFGITTGAVAAVLMLAVYWRRWDTD